jgi:hypothetical protein
MRVGAKVGIPKSAWAKLAIAAGLVALLVLGFAAAPASAKKTHLFLEDFGSANQPLFGGGTAGAGVMAMAIDQSTGDLLVIDSGSQSVSRWNPDGTPASFSGLGTNVIDGKGTGECPAVPADCDQTPQNGLALSQQFAFAGEAAIAVDNSGTVTDGNIYVTEGSSLASPHVVDIFSSSGKYLGRISGAGATEFAHDKYFAPGGVAVDPAGNLFVSTGYEEKIYKYDPSANPPVNADAVATFSGISLPLNIAAGVGPSSGSLFVNTYFGGISKMDSTTGALEYTVHSGRDLLVVTNPADGHVYVYNFEQFLFNHDIFEFDASGAGGASIASSFRAGTNSSFDGGEQIHALAVQASTGNVYVSKRVRVEVYGPTVTVPDVSTGAASITGETSATLHGTVNPDGVAIEECRFEYGLTSSYGQTAPCAETPAEVGSGTAPKGVHADIGGLATETAYHVRLVAKNLNATIKGPDQVFRTPGKPEITGQWAASVGTEEATVSAAIDPNNDATTFRVEWGTDATYGQSSGELPVGSDDSAHTVSSVLGGLEPATTYHWRAVATNGFGVVEGEDGSFKTYGQAPAGLPDERVYELVSPLDKNGGEVAAPTPAGGTGAVFSVQPQQASRAGDAITYASATSFGEGAESAPAASQYLSRRDGQGGWSTENVNPRFEEGYLRSPAMGFSEDLSHAALFLIQPSLTPEAADGFRNLYWRDNNAGGALATLTSGTPSLGATPKDQYCPYYAGSSADSERVFFAADGALREGDPVSNNLYEWSAQRPVAEALQLVSLLPNDTPAEGGNSFGGSSNVDIGNCLAKGSLMREAISASGSRAFWTYRGTYAGPKGKAQSPLFARVDGTETIQLDAPQGPAGAGGEGQYWNASADGSKVFFTDAKKLTTDANITGAVPDLYRYDFDKEAGQRLTDLSAHAGEPANVQGVVGVSEDGSYAYFVAKGALDAGAQAGENNLYAWHEGEEVRFVATLSSEDEVANWTSDPTHQTARVSPDGGAVAFVSAESLTGFDNRVASGGCRVVEKGLGGKAPECDEVFLYDYEADELACASCSPAGTRPLGPARLPAWSTPYEQPRYLNEDGSRLFFETLDVLDPHDTNGKRDVYELERPGTGGCSAQSTNFNPDAGGCIYLVSSGSSGDESYFLDASDSGDDVFLATREGLVYTDEDGRYDVYDARVGGQGPPPPPQNCEGEGCRGEGTSAPPAQAPGSGAFEGPGDPIPARGCPKGRHQVKKGGKTRCVKPKPKKHRKKHQRASHKRRASR